MKKIDLIQCTHRCPRHRRCLRYVETADNNKAIVKMIDYMQLKAEEAKKVECPMFAVDKDAEPPPPPPASTKPNEDAAEELSQAEKLALLEEHDPQVAKLQKTDPKLAELVKMVKQAGRQRSRRR